MWTDGPIPGYAVADTGAYVLAAFKDPGRWIGSFCAYSVYFVSISLCLLGERNVPGKDIKILTEIFTPRQLVALLEEVSGKKIELKEISYETFGESKNGGSFLAEIHGKFVLFLEPESNVVKLIILVQFLSPYLLNWSTSPCDPAWVRISISAVQISVQSF